MNPKSTSFLARLGVYALVALGLSVLSGTGNYASAIFSNEPARWLPIFGWAVAGWGLWWLLSPAAMLLARRFPLGRGQSLKHVAVHATAAVLFVIVHEIVFVTLIVTLEPEINTVPMMMRIAAARLGGYAVLGTMIYAAVLAAEHMIENRERARRREVEASRLEAELAEARLQSVAAQLQPHFLFNTLNAATGLLRDGRPDAAADVLVELGDLLRDSLDGLGKSVVTLEHEQATLRRYLAIQQVRFGDRIATVVDMPDETLSALLPHFLLQPLVENAFQHGLSKTTDPGTVTITARVDDDRLRLQVSDSGPGFTPAHGEGTGLRNTRARLRQACGDDFKLTCEGAGGGRVTVEMPLRTEAGR